MAFPDNKTTIMVTRGDKTVLQDIEPKILLKKPTLSAPTIAAKYINPSVLDCVEGKFIVLHKRDMNMDHDSAALIAANDSKTDYPMTAHEAIKYAKAKRSSNDKEKLTSDNLA